LLTSHSMDECETLCGRLAIMVNGTFQCIGSPQHLKTRFGDGYTVIAQVDARAGASVIQAQELLSARLPMAKLITICNGRLEYNLNARDMPPLRQLFTILEDCSKRLRLVDYSVTQTSLDSIFCRFAALQNSDRGTDNDKPDQHDNELLPYEP